MGKNDMLVSVVVLTYNDAPFIEETLNSIKDQTYKNIEIISIAIEREKMYNLR